MECHMGVCGKCWAAKYIVLGLILFGNFWFNYTDAWAIVGVVLVLKGIIMLAKPGGCGHCNEEMPKKGKK